MKKKMKGVTTAGHGNEEKGHKNRNIKEKDKDDKKQTRHSLRAEVFVLDGQEIKGTYLTPFFSFPLSSSVSAWRRSE